VAADERAADLIALHEALEILAQRNESLGMLRDLGAAEDAIGLGLEGYGRLRLLEGRESATDSLLREALAMHRSTIQKHYKEGDQRLAQARTDLGLALVRQRRPAEAESLLVGSFPQLSPYEQPRAATSSRSSTTGSVGPRSPRLTGTGSPPPAPAHPTEATERHWSGRVTSLTVSTHPPRYAPTSCDRGRTLTTQSVPDNGWWGRRACWAGITTGSTQGAGSQPR
jgi:hypothetical protein